jgi:ABC-2 type transport system permease protein
VRGERIKLLSLRSTWLALASTAAVITLVALAASLNAMADDPALAPGIEQMHGAEVISSGFHFGMLTIAVLGALLITGEYATGLISSTFAAVPTRIPVLAAKALTLVVLTAAVTLVSVTLSYFVTMPSSRSTTSSQRWTTRAPGACSAAPSTPSSPPPCSRSASARTYAPQLPA